jgi:hypothetical protein
VKTIWKYVLEMPNQLIDMPEGAVIMTAAEQGGNICIWAEVDPDSERMRERLFQTVGTGHDIQDDIGVERKYIGTAMLQGGASVLHVYERNIL